MCTAAEKVTFFDAVSQDWDKQLDLPALHQSLLKELKHFGIQPDEQVLEIGCGTGNLTQALLETLGPSGRVTALEISMRMLERAQNKIGVDEPRVRWQVADAAHPLPFHDASIDRIMFYQVWPHFGCHETVLRHCLPVLKPGGKLHIWHTDSREAVNKHHAQSKHAAIAKDVLPPAEEVAQLLEKAGLKVSEATESGKHYLVSASKP